MKTANKIYSVALAVLFLFLSIRLLFIGDIEDGSLHIPLWILFSSVSLLIIMTLSIDLNFHRYNPSSIFNIINRFIFFNHKVKFDNGKMIISSFGDKFYYEKFNSKYSLGRIDGPSIEYADGGKEWYLNGKLNREDGPAIERDDVKYWYLDGKLHRENGPAIDYVSGKYYWYLNGELHREDGPAINYGNGIEVYCIHGNTMDKDDFYSTNISNVISTSKLEDFLLDLSDEMGNFSISLNDNDKKYIISFENPHFGGSRYLKEIASFCDRMSYLGLKVDIDLSTSNLSLNQSKFNPHGPQRNNPQDKINRKFRLIVRI